MFRYLNTQKIICTKYSWRGVNSEKWEDIISTFNSYYVSIKHRKMIMYRIRSKFAWKLTTVWAMVSETASENVDIAFDWWYGIQKSYDGTHWIAATETKYYNEKDAYGVMCHLICKESEKPVTVDKFINQN